MRISSLLFVVVMLLGAALPAQAADWVMAIGTEEGRPETPVQIIGFGQLHSRALLFSTPVDGLTSPHLAVFNGQAASFNATQTPVELRLRRARVGLRGTIPGTEGWVSYFVNVEGGMNAATRGRGFALLDVSATFSLVPGVRIRVGQFKVPTSDEALEVIPTSQAFTDFALATSQLLFEQPVGNGAFDGPGWAFRDIGIQAFDTFVFGKLAVAYAVMAHQGRMGAVDDNTGKDITGRLMLSWLPSGKPLSPMREEFSAFAWWSQGPRTLDGEDVLRVRQGAGVFARYQSLRVRAEIIGAQGALFAGQKPSFAGQPLVVIPDGQAVGWYADGIWTVHGPLDVSFGVEELHRQFQEPAQYRHFRNFSAGVQWRPFKKVRIMGEYEIRRIYAPGASADIQRITSTIGSFANLQLTIVL